MSRLPMPPRIALSAGRSVPLGSRVRLAGLLLMSDVSSTLTEAAPAMPRAAALYPRKFVTFVARAGVAAASWSVTMKALGTTPQRGRTDQAIGLLIGGPAVGCQCLFPGRLHALAADERHRVRRSWPPYLRRSGAARIIRPRPPSDRGGSMPDFSLDAKYRLEE